MAEAQYASRDGEEDVTVSSQLSVGTELVYFRNRG
jgi:hypothetical protein